MRSAENTVGVGLRLSLIRKRVAERWAWVGLACLAAALGHAWAAEDVSRRGGKRLERRTPGVLRSFVREVEVEQNGRLAQRIFPGLRLGAGDRIRTGPAASALIHFANNDDALLWEDTELVILPSPSGSLAPSLLRGLVRVSTIGPREPMAWRTAHGTVTHSKTEFWLQVEGDSTMVRVLDGEAELTNDFGRQVIGTGEAAVVVNGEAPRLLPVLPAKAGVQWWLYYPSVVDPGAEELRQGLGEDLADVLAAYRRGNLVEALHRWPGFPRAGLSGESANGESGRGNGGGVAGSQGAGGESLRSPRNSAEAALLGTLWLGVGHVERARVCVGRWRDGGALVRAVQRLLEAVSEGAVEAMDAGATASEWLARSYQLQRLGRLPAALAASERALERSANFGFAHARRAELLFGLGRLSEARTEAARALELAPDHAEAWVVLGFHDLASARYASAERCFDRSLELQPRLGDAWLGRGLVNWRRGRTEFALEDMRLAVAAEPERSLHRSYLGKALAETRQGRVAREEFRRARETDGEDPTPWLYEALLDRAENRPIEALRGLGVSQSLNDRRAVYRSRHLLDEDRAARGAGQAKIYEDLGLSAFAGTAGALAVAADPVNYSAHAFLAEAFNRQRDPRQGDLRYETPWMSEYLLANLLAPPGAGILSQAVAQNEYSRLLQRDGPGWASDTRYSSSGAWWQGASQFGTWRGSEYAADVLYRSDPGPAPNRDFEDLTLSLQAKQQVGWRDSFFVQALRYRAEGGDPTPTFDGRARQPSLRFEELQEPQLLIGHHHSWSPEAHTLVLAGRLHGDLTVTNSVAGQYLTVWDPADQGFTHLLTNTVQLGRETSLEAWILELQQLQRIGNHQIVAGLRSQAGEFETLSSYYQPVLLRDLPGIGGNFRSRLREQSASPAFGRWGGYVYDRWEIGAELSLVGGMTYDRLERPFGWDTTPVVASEDAIEAWSPSVGLLARPWSNGVFRAGWARSLGGLSFEQSVRLEPTQVAGFVHGWRGLMPETIPAQSMEILGLAYDHWLSSNTLASVEVGWRGSTAEQRPGVVLVRSRAEETAGWLGEEWRYDQFRSRVGLSRLLGHGVVLGVSYEYSDSEWQRELTGYSGSGASEAARLQALHLDARWFHSRGWFAQVGGRWVHQDYESTGFGEGAVEHGVLDVHGGWRGWQRRVEVVVGVENLTDSEARLMPVSGAPEGPFERAAVVRFRVQF